MNPEELIASYLDGTLDDAGGTQLNSWLKASPENMKRFTSAVKFDGQVRMAVHARASAPVTQTLMNGERPLKPSRWIQWRPVWAAVAGLVIGLFSASLVFGYVAQRQIQTQILLREDFENVEMIRDRGVPARVNVWSGDLLAPQEGAREVKPVKGRRMIMLPVVEKRKFSYAFRFVDLAALRPLSAGQSREIEVTAQFHGSAPSAKDRFQIRLAAFADEVEAAREIWVRDHVDEQALMHVAKTVRSTPGDPAWTTAHCRMDVPSNARLVLISLAAGADSDSVKTDHYLDDVEVRLITTDRPKL